MAVGALLDAFINGTIQNLYWRFSFYRLILKRKALERRTSLKYPKKAYHIVKYSCFVLFTTQKQAI